ncbi:hypothetical protein F511_44580 [Dorcoceras hygrometricum]|uniref:Uncharacterized protein n=1 Tax=Dorcoceras hygrometricum TaxID=472368 RepID=A0A2Z7A5A0_9LAMI|nr:hypothetical protein F511_44580 [Dorcoceras hygrometricum]
MSEIHEHVSSFSQTLTRMVESQSRMEEAQWRMEQWVRAKMEEYRERVPRNEKQREYDNETSYREANDERKAHFECLKKLRTKR